jgi:hypothetical protein
MSAAPLARPSISVGSITAELMAPLPTCPWSFAPQHIAAPVEVIAHVCSYPVSILTALPGSPDTVTGTLLRPVV